MYFYNKLKSKSMKFLVENVTFEASQIPIVKYGLEILLMNFLKSIALFTTAFYLGILKETIIFFLCFGAIRIFAAGAHATTSLICNIVTFTTFLGNSYLIKNFPMSTPRLLICFAFSFYLIFRYSPSATKSKPIVSSNLRRTLKIKSLLICIILFLLVLIIQNITYRNIITYAVLIESIFLTPTSYKILGQEFVNNEDL
jgi:accessory gene regulator B